MILRELLPLVLLCLAVTIEFRHIAEGMWRQIFLYNSDSLTLVQVQQSLAQHQSFNWIFSSQSFIFPEGPLFVVSSILTTSVRASLLFNATLNVLLFYGLLRALARYTNLSIRASLRPVVCLIPSLLLVGFMLLERQPSTLNGSQAVQGSLATLFLFTTYYYGVIIAGLISILLAFSLVQSLRSGRSPKMLMLLALLSMLVSGLTTFSDPLYIIQFFIPFLLVVGIVALYGLLSPARSLFIALLFSTGTALGYLCRQFFPDLFAEGLGHYINLQKTPTALHAYLNSAKTVASSVGGTLELISVILIIMTALLYGLLLVKRRRNHKRDKLDPLLIFMVLFSGVAPVVTFIIVAFSGNTTTRYFVPLITFPLLVLLPLLQLGLRRIRGSVVLIGYASIAIIIIVFGTLSLHTAANLLTPKGFSNSTCLSQALNDQPAVGVAQYWDARPLAVYSPITEPTLQANSNISVFPWLTNLSNYRHTNYSFIVVDRFESSNRAILANDVVFAGVPERIAHCTSYDIYIYKSDSVSSQLISKQMDLSYQHVLSLQQTGNLHNILEMFP